MALPGITQKSLRIFVSLPFPPVIIDIIDTIVALCCMKQFFLSRYNIVLPH